MKNIAARNPWPIGLVIFFILFGGYIVGFVVFASSQRMDLVREDYYDQEIRFQQQIDRVKRTDPVMAAAGVNYDLRGDMVTVTLPPAVASARVSGTISFYRPSDSGLDRDIPLAPDANGAQSVSTRAFTAGLWKVRVQWKVDSQEFFFEKPVVIRPAQRS